MGVLRGNPPFLELEHRFGGFPSKGNPSFLELEHLFGGFSRGGQKEKSHFLGVPLRKDTPKWPPNAKNEEGGGSKLLGLSQLHPSFQLHDCLSQF